MVSLNNYKGKVVYIDFWGVNCSPCVGDIKYYVPQLHEHYHNKDVIFLNICIDVDEKLWKKAISKYNLGGVNLLTEGGFKNKACKTYNVNAVPQYILIDRSGKIAEPNAPRPYEKDRLYSSIDKLLEAP